MLKPFRRAAGLQRKMLTAQQTSHGGGIRVGQWRRGGVVRAAVRSQGVAQRNIAGQTTEVSILDWAWELNSL